MEERLLENATQWTLQEDEDVRKLLNDFKNGVTFNGAKLKLNVNKIKHKLLNTDCEIQQLNTQLALLKNTKYVEAGVEDEDSRPKPPPQVVLPTKDELIKVTVDAVKEVLQNIPSQMNCERASLTIDGFPGFNSIAFNSFSVRPSAVGVQQTSTTIEPDEHYENHLQPSPPYKIEPIIAPTPSAPTLVPPSLTSSLNGLPSQVRGAQSSDNEEEEVPPFPTKGDARISTAPPPPDMSGFNNHQGKLPVLTKPKSLFSSDEEDDEQVTTQVLQSSPPRFVQSITPVVPKPKDDLMEQLTAKLKTKETKTSQEKKVCFVDDRAVSKTTAPEVGTPVTHPESVTGSEDQKKQKPLSIQQKQTVASERIVLPDPKETSPAKSKVPPPISQPKAIEVSKPKPTSWKAEPQKKRGLFSDSDSDEDFLVPKVIATKPTEIEIKKTEASKNVVKKPVPVRKSIFDSDSEDDSFTDYFKKLSPAPGVSSLPQKSFPVTPQVTEAKKDIKPRLKEESEPVLPGKDTVKPNSRILENSQQAPKTAQKPSVPPKEEESCDHSSVIDPLSAAEPTQDKKKSSQSSQDSVKNIVTSVASTDCEIGTKESIAQYPATSLLQQNSTSTTVVVPITDSAAEANTINPISPPIIKERKTILISTVEQKTPSLEEISALTEIVPPIPDLSVRSKSPEEIEQAENGPLIQENLPPLPTEDPLNESPPVSTMPVGKTPGKLNNANFAAMLGSKLSAGPPGMRPVTTPSRNSESALSESVASPSSNNNSTKIDTSTTSLPHLTKDRPRRSGVKRPTLHKSTEEPKKVDTNNHNSNCLPGDVVNGVSSMNITSPIKKTITANQNKSDGDKKNTSVNRSPTIEKKTQSPKTEKIGNESSKPSTVLSTEKPASGPALKADVNISITTSATLTTKAAPSRKGLFDFSSSDEELSPPTKITKDATTLKSTVICTQSEPTASSTTTTATSSTNSNTTSNAKTNARLNKYKSMFDQEDDIDVSLFKKS